MKKSKGTKGLKGIWKKNKDKLKSEIDSATEEKESKPSTSGFGCRESSTSEASTSKQVFVPSYILEHLQPKVSLNPSAKQSPNPKQKYPYEEYQSSYSLEQPKFLHVEQHQGENKYLPVISSGTKIKSPSKMTSCKTSDATKDVSASKVKLKETKREHSKKVSQRSHMALSLSFLRCTIAERLSFKSSPTKIPKESLEHNNLASPSWSEGIKQKHAPPISDYNFLSPLNQTRTTLTKTGANREKQVSFGPEDREINKSDRMVASNTQHYVDQESKEMDVTLRADKISGESIKRKVKKKFKVHALSTSIPSQKRTRAKAGKLYESSSEESPKSKPYARIGVDHVALRQKLLMIDPSSDRELTTKSPTFPPTPQLLSQPSSPLRFLQPLSNKSPLERNRGIIEKDSAASYYGYYPSYFLTYPNSLTGSVSSNSSQFPFSSSSSNRQSSPLFSNSPSPVQNVFNMPSFETFHPLGTSTPRLPITHPNSFVNQPYVSKLSAHSTSNFSNIPASSSASLYSPNSPSNPSPGTSPLESLTSTLCSVSSSHASTSIPYFSKPGSSKSQSISQCLSNLPSQCSVSSPIPQGFYLLNPSFTVPYLSGAPLRPLSIQDIGGNYSQVGQHFNREYFVPNLDSQIYIPTTTESSNATFTQLGVPTLHSYSTDQQYSRTSHALSNLQPCFELSNESRKPSSFAGDQRHPQSQHTSDALRVVFPYSSDTHISSSESRLPSLGIICPQSPKLDSRQAAPLLKDHCDDEPDRAHRSSEEK